MITIHLQNVSNEQDIPADKTLRHFALLSVLRAHFDSGELTLRIVDVDEMQTLNKQYRQQDKPTNVLAFPFIPFNNINVNQFIIGDVVICAAVINAEAKQQHKSQAQHWAHIIIHGVLHLLGYDHDNAAAAEKMESIEIELLQQLGYSNPYS